MSVYCSQYFLRKIRITYEFYLSTKFASHKIAIGPEFHIKQSLHYNQLIFFNCNFTFISIFRHFTLRTTVRFLKGNNVIKSANCDINTYYLKTKSM